MEARVSPSSIPWRDLRIRGGSISDIDAPMIDVIMLGPLKLIPSSTTP